MRVVDTEGKTVAKISNIAEHFIYEENVRQPGYTLYRYSKPVAVWLNYNTLVYLNNVYSWLGKPSYNPSITLINSVNRFKTVLEFVKERSYSYYCVNPIPMSGFELTVPEIQMVCAIKGIDVPHLDFNFKIKRKRNKKSHEAERPE